MTPPVNTTPSTTTTTPSTTTTTTSSFSSTPTTTTFTTTTPLGGVATVTVKDSTATTFTVTTTDASTNTTTTTETNTIVTGSASTTTGGGTTTTTVISSTTTTTTQTPVETTTETEIATTTTVTQPDGTTSTDTEISTTDESTSQTTTTTASSTTKPDGTTITTRPTTTITTTARPTITSTKASSSTTPQIATTAAQGENDNTKIAGITVGAVSAVVFSFVLALIFRRKFKVQEAHNQVSPRVVEQYRFEEGLAEEIDISDSVLIEYGLIQVDSSDEFKAAAHRIASQLIKIGWAMMPENKESFIQNFNTIAFLIKNDEEVRGKRSIRFSLFNNVLTKLCGDESTFRRAVDKYNETNDLKLEVKGGAFDYYDSPKGPSIYDVPQRLRNPEYNNLDENAEAVADPQSAQKTFITPSQLADVTYKLLNMVTGAPRGRQSEASSGLAPGVVYEASAGRRFSGGASSIAYDEAREEGVPVYPAPRARVEQRVEYANADEAGIRRERRRPRGQESSGGAASMGFYGSEYAAAEDLLPDEGHSSVVGAQQSAYTAAEDDERRGVNRGAAVYSAVNKSKPKTIDMNQGGSAQSSTEFGFKGEDEYLMTEGVESSETDARENPSSTPRSPIIFGEKKVEEHSV